MRKLFVQMVVFTAAIQTLREILMVNSEKTELTN